MTSSGTTKRHRFGSYALAIALLACVLLASAVVVLEAGHDDCPGEENCPVCQMVLVAKASLNFTTAARPVSAPAAAFRAAPATVPRFRSQFLAIADSLVQRKIRLNN